jgi:hypothetical protein
VDPEALLLMSLWMQEHERRLEDVVWSWVKINSPLLSIQRLANIKSDFPPEVAGRLADLARHRVKVAKDHRWKSLQEGGTAAMTARGAKVRAVEPRFTDWSTLMLQLRLGMGVGVKADVLTLLLGSSTPPGFAEVATIAGDLGYTTAAVRRAADDLGRARFLRSRDMPDTTRSTPRMFSGQPSAWTSLLGMKQSQPVWAYSRQRFGFLIEVLTWLDRVRAKTPTPYAMDVESRGILTRHARAFVQHEVVDPLGFATTELDFAYLERAARALTRWLKNHG